MTVIQRLTESWQIIQRDSDGFGRAVFGGELAEVSSDTVVFVRTVREDDNIPVIEWDEAEIDGNRWSYGLILPEGGLYRVEACLKESGYTGYGSRIKILYHVGVGDIYILAGQSNMTGYGQDTAYDPPCLGVHSFANDGHWRLAVHPLADASDMIYDNPETASGTSPALSFARRLKEVLGIPIGIVPTAVGGTKLSTWHPEQDGSNYRSMMKRFEKLGKIKGFLWFQGCSDALENEARDYYERFVRMLNLWRGAVGDVPMITVQLNRWTNPTENLAFDRRWGMVRDAQRRASLELDKVYTVPSYDLPMSDGIHNGSGSNVTIGERCANIALREIYGKVGLTAPVITSAEFVDSTHVKLKISGGHRLCATDGMAYGMNAEDGAGLIECTAALADNGEIIVTTRREYTLPAKFHYAWRCHSPNFCVKDYFGYPLLACYGVEIEEK